jgi:hypothetical protein
MLEPIAVVEGGDLRQRTYQSIGRHLIVAPARSARCPTADDQPASSRRWTASCQKQKQDKVPDRPDLDAHDETKRRPSVGEIHSSQGSATMSPGESDCSSP